MPPGIAAQEEIFTIYPEPGVAFTSDSPDRFAIPVASGKSIKMTLYKLGVRAEKLFPDLDALA
jgi:hypothetical protein